MVSLYKLINKKFDPDLSMYFFLLLHITIWFFAGAIIGALLSLLLLRISMLPAFTLTFGALSAIVLGYIYGYIAVIRNI